MSEFVTLASGLDFPEGPSVADDGAIWLSELRRGRIVRVDADGGIECWFVGGAPNGTALAGDGTLWFCDAQRGEVRKLDPATGRTETVIDRVGGQLLAAPNDLAFHPDGSLIFTCPGTSRRDPTGYVCRRSPGGTVAIVANGMLFPNGICFSADGSEVLVAETYACRVVRGTWNPAAALDLEPLLMTPGPIGADGVAVAGDGTVHSCVYGAGLLRTRSAADQTVHDLALPDAHPAGCAIDPLGRWDVLVTGTATGVLLGVNR